MLFTIARAENVLGKEALTQLVKGKEALSDLVVSEQGLVGEVLLRPKGSRP